MMVDVLGLALPPLQFALYSLSNEGSDWLALLQNRSNALARPLGESSRYLLFVDLFASHDWNIDDITYCYKSLFCGCVNRNR